MPWQVWYRSGWATQSVSESQWRSVSSFWLRWFSCDWGIRNVDVILDLTNEKGNPTTGRLTVRIAQKSIAAVDAVIQQVQPLAQNLSRPAANITDTVTNVTDTIANQHTLITSFESLLAKVGVLLKVGDEVAKVCSSLSSSLSCLAQIIEDSSLC